MESGAIVQAKRCLKDATPQKIRERKDKSFLTKRDTELGKNKRKRRYPAGASVRTGPKEGLVCKERTVAGGKYHTV